MNIHRVIAIGLALILGASGANAADEASSDPLIPVSISGEKLGDILEQLGSQYGYNFIVDSEIRVDSRGPHTYVAPIPASRALRVVAAAYGACAVVREAVVIFRQCDDGDHSAGASAIGQPNDQPRVLLGVVIEEKAAEHPTNGDAGVAVTGIDWQGAGYEAGIRVGDVILSYNGESISRGIQLQSLIGNTRSGDRAPVVVLRGSERISFNVQF